MSDMIFICHASENAEIANIVCTDLEKNNIKCWIAPRDTEVGNFMGSLTKAIKNSTLLVLIYSEFANESPYVIREIQKAIDLKIPIIPFRISEVEPSEEMEFAISSQHWIDGFSGEMDKRVAILSSKVKEKLKIDSTELPAKPINYVGIHFTDEDLKMVNIMSDCQVSCDCKDFSLHKNTSEKELLKEVISVVDDIVYCVEDEDQVGNVNQIESISIMVPGPTKEEGKVHIMPRARGEQSHTMGMKTVLLKKLKYNGNINILNDANAAAKAEYYFRNAELDESYDTSSLVYIYWSGGIGSGVVIDDKLISGNNGYAGEIGHAKISNYGPLCSCGGAGCVESYLSEGALKKQICRSYERHERMYQRFKNTDHQAPKLPPLLSHKGSPKDADNINIEAFLKDACLTGEAALAWQNEVLDRIINIYAITISNLICNFDPELIVFGGNLGRCINPDIIDLINKEIHKHTFITGFKLEKTRYNEFAVAFGGYLNIHKLEENDKLRDNIMNMVKI